MTPDYTDEFTLRVSVEGAVAPGVRNLVCEIWFAYGTRAFPDEEWTDFAVSILVYWLDELFKFKHGRTDRLEFTFMDSPYEVWADPCTDPGLWWVRCVSCVNTNSPEAAGDVLEDWGQITRADVEKAIYQAAGVLIDESQTRGWAPLQLDSLVYCRDRLRCLDS